MSARNLAHHAITELEHLQKGVPFIVRDLFVGYQWDREAIEDRQVAGRLFFDYANENLSRIKILGKTESGQQIYEMI